MKILISRKTGIYYYYKEGSGDYHCKEGFIKKEDLESKSNLVLTNSNIEFLKFDANNYDYLQKIKRGPQIITLKDLGYISARTLMNKNSVVLEAGGGSGAATIYFSGICKEVITYEIKNENYKLIKKNLNYMGVENVNLLLGDIVDNIENLEKNIDVLFLDMPDSQVVLKKDLSIIKKGGFIVCYVPSITQIFEINNVLDEKKNDFYVEEISECILRNWKVRGRVARPEHRKEIDHTAFLIFIRKIN